MRKSGLSDKHERFCREYLKDCNATQAYIRAGYEPKDASVSGSRLLANAKVKARIAELQARRAEKLEISADAILARLNALAQNRDPDGREVRHFDQIEAAKLVGKHLKLFVEKVELSGEINIADRLSQMRAALNRGKS